MSMKDYGLDGFKKIGQEGGTFIVATFWNEKTNEIQTKCVRDYDYSDCSRDIDELYYMPIDEDASKKYGHSIGLIFDGDFIEVFKGRKVPIGTVAKVKKIYAVKDKYNRWVADYALLENGMRTNVNNCRYIEM